MKNILNFVRKSKIQDETGEPPWSYYFLLNLDESEYPKYLAKIFKYRTGEKLPLKYDFKNKSWVIDKKRCKTFNQKIQWIKLYGITDLMRDCTDKVKVRDYVAEKIGSEYLKPVLQVIPSLNCDCHVIARNNSTLGDEAIQMKRSQKAMYENSEIKSNNNISWTATDFFLNLQIQSYYYQPVSLCKSHRSDGKIDALHPKFNDMTTYFDQIDWENLPNAFVIKCNHGCKWQYIIKNKEEFLKNKRLFNIVKRSMTGWLQQEYWCWGGFEMQYATSRRVESPDSTLRVRTRLSEGIACDSDNEASDLPERKGCQDKNRGIEPKIIIEKYLGSNDKLAQEIEVFCFNGKPKIIKKVHNDVTDKLTMYDENLNYINLKFKDKEFLFEEKADKLINQTIDLSINLSKNFCFVRCDWLIFENRIYFNELTFTPNSGLIPFDKKWNLKLGSWINLERSRHGL